MLIFEKLRAPAADGQTLLEPAPAQWASLIEDNRRRQQQQAMELAGAPVDAVRESTRRRLMGPQADKPVLATGHQPAFIHPGVWAKHVVVDHAARRHKAAALDLVVDNDAPASSALVVPVVGPDQLVTALAIPFYSGSIGCPYEGRPLLNATELGERRDALRAALGPAAAETAIGQYLEGLASVTAAGDAVQQHQAGRTAVDSGLGVNLRTARVSDAFGGPFVADLLLQAERFARAYNEALRAYRCQEQVRGAQRPLPDLGVDGDQIETALWVYRVLQPRRRLWVSRRGDRLVCYAERVPIGELGVKELQRSPDAALAGLRPWVVRPRALTLTLWARLLVCDLFLHGIGGAKYDRITDGLFRRYYECAPPAYVCVSATMRLTLYRHQVSFDDWRSARRAVRDVRYNPQRYLAQLPEESLARRQGLIAESDRLRVVRAGQPTRQRTFLAIREVNAQLMACEPGAADCLAASFHQIQRQLESNRVAESREFFYALQPRSRLAALEQCLRDALC